MIHHPPHSHVQVLLMELEVLLYETRDVVEGMVVSFSNSVFGLESCLLGCLLKGLEPEVLPVRVGLANIDQQWDLVELP